MAISWSGWKSVGAPVNFRTGIDITYSPSSVTSATSSVTVTTRLYLGASGSAEAAGGSYTITGSDSGSGSQVAWDLNPGGGTALFATLTETVTLNYGSSQSFTINATIRPSGSWPGSVSHSRTITLPARPVSAPQPVTSMALTQRSDTEHVLSWTRNGSSSAPYDRIRVTRWDQVGGEYVTVALLGGLADTFTDTTTRSNRNYRYAVRAENSAGNSAFAYVNVSTTPAAPAAPSVKKTATGDIVITRPALSSAVMGNIASDPGTWQVWHAADGVWDAAPLASRAVTLSTYTHPAPSKTQTHTYRLRSVNGSGTVSAYSPSSDTIQLEAPPLVPNNFGPAAADATEDITLTWRHNPADGAPQTAYEVEYRTLTGQTWGEYAPLSGGKVVSPDSEHVVPAGTFTNGQWTSFRVRTWGTHPDPSSYAPSMITLSARPVVGITSPATTYDSQVLTVEWTFHDSEASAQSAWRAVLSTGTDVLEILEGDVAATRSATFATPVTDGGTYTVTVEARDGALLWSDPVDSTFTVSYNPPPNPTISAEWHGDDGYTTLSVDVPEPGVGEELVSHLRVERATVDGWVTVADELDAPATVVDMIPPTNAAVAYRAVAVSVLGSLAVTEDVVQTDTPWVFVNHGPGFGDVLRLRGNVTASRAAQRTKTLHYLAGRELPVERAGVHRTRTYELSGVLAAPRYNVPEMPARWSDVEALENALAPVCVRDPEGTRLFTSVGGVSLSGAGQPTRSVSIPLTVVDWSEV